MNRAARSSNPVQQGSQELWRAGIPTNQGLFVAGYSCRGLSRLDFPGTSEPNDNGQQLPPQFHAWHELTRTALRHALEGKPAGKLPPLDLSSGTDFQRAVWRALTTIAVGTTWSYGQVARAIDRPKATRAVGGACGRNPIPVFVPCHRVLAAGGQIGGFSADMDWKLKLLRAEGSWPPGHP